jgi:NLI interacting factor-like phosphatase
LYEKQHHLLNRPSPISVRPFALGMLRPLLILDLNGTILHRLTRSHERSIARTHPSYTGPSYTVNGNPCFLRPHLHAFLQWAFDVFEVGIWTSARKKNAIPMTVKALHHLVDFGEMEAEVMSFIPLSNPVSDDTKKHKLKFLWHQEQCTVEGGGKRDVDFSYKPHFVKDLNVVFSHYHQYDTTNTFIVDDSSKKIKPEHSDCLIKVKEFRVDDPAIDYKSDEELLNLKTILQRKLASIGDDCAHDRQKECCSKGVS